MGLEEFKKKCEYLEKELFQELKKYLEEKSDQPGIQEFIDQVKYTDLKNCELINFDYILEQQMKTSLLKNPNDRIILKKNFFDVGSLH